MSVKAVPYTHCIFFEVLNSSADFFSTSEERFSLPVGVFGKGEILHKLLGHN